MPSRPATVSGSRLTARPCQPAPARPTLPATSERDQITESAPVHVTVDGGCDHLGDYPETGAGGNDVPRPAATRSRKRWPFVLPPGWKEITPAKLYQSPLDEECPP